MSIISFAACLLMSSVTAELSGRVVNETGEPVAQAIVVVSTARPRVGPRTTCPSCYRDCTKRTLTNEQGEFKIKGLSDLLQFTLAAGASGHQGTVSEYVDPASNPALELKLSPLPNQEESNRIKGQVVDLEDKPIAGAELRVQTIRRASGIIGGSDDSVTTLTLSDNEGNFELSAGDHIVAFDVRGVATGYAANEVHWSRTDNRDLKIELGRGASLKGKLVFQGKPVPNVEVGLVQKNRIIGNIVTPQEVHTDESGEFHFEGLPPDLDYTIYTHTGQNAPAALPVTLVTAPGHGERAQFGEIPLQSPSRLTIIVKTEDGSKLPKDSYVMVMRQEAWRGAKEVLQQTSIAHAEFNDVPKENFQIIVRVPGYDVARTKPPTNLDMNRRYGINVNGDTTIEFMMKSQQPSKLPTPPNKVL